MYHHLSITCLFYCLNKEVLHRKKQGLTETSVLQRTERFLNLDAASIIQPCKLCLSHIQYSCSNTAQAAGISRLNADHICQRGGRGMWLRSIKYDRHTAHRQNVIKDDSELGKWRYPSHVLPLSQNTDSICPFAVLYQTVRGGCGGDDHAVPQGLRQMPKQLWCQRLTLHLMLTCSHWDRVCN